MTDKFKHTVRLLPFLLALAFGAQANSNPDKLITNTSQAMETNMAFLQKPPGSLFMKIIQQHRQAPKVILGLTFSKEDFIKLTDTSFDRQDAPEDQESMLGFYLKSAF